jgi:two-component system phosphate regulon sensor histidine kinase PhoR
MRTSSFLFSAIILALIATIMMVTSGVNVAIALIVLLIWSGSLLLVGGAPPDSQNSGKSQEFSTTRMSELIESSQAPMMITRRDKIIIANAAARDLLGAHIIEQDVRIALRHPQAIQLIDSNETSSAVIQGLARRKDIWEITRKILDGGLAMFELVNRTAEADISRAHTDFVANASHELRTPLASVIGYVETLREDGASLDTKTAQSFLGTIDKEAHRMQRLVSDLMSLSRIEAEKHDSPSAQIDLAALTKRAANDAAGPNRLARIDFAAHGEFTVTGDTQQLEQLIRNLVDNGLKYGAEGEPVTIRLQAQGDKRVRLTVKDRGEGIPAEHIPHLTRRFYRTDPGRSRASGGTGLGLAIVKHVVERHRGRLSIDSEAGKGTRVKIVLPLADKRSKE